MYKWAQAVLHIYLQSSIISFADFNQEIEASKFEVEAYMKNFRPTSIETERKLQFLG